MDETYFEYTLSQCRTQIINSVCSVVNTRNALLKKAQQGFNGCINITADWRLFEAVTVCFQNTDIINSDCLNRDGEKVYARCRNIAFAKERLNYDKQFDYLVEVNWLLASVHYSRLERTRKIALLNEPITIKDCIRDYLTELYNSAIEDYNECVYIDEAFQARKKILQGLYPFKYEESKRYLSRYYLPSELEEIRKDYRGNSICKMALFYGLTATAALENNIRRFG